MRICLSIVVLMFVSAFASAAEQELQVRWMAAAMERGYDPTADVGGRVLSFRVGVAPGLELNKWDESVLGPVPDEADLPSYEDALVTLAAMEVAAEASRQAAKPAERKIMENLFYQLVGQVLTAAGDPRAEDEQIPKLGFPEITALVEVVQMTDPMAAVNLSLKLLSVDAALKRYDLLWWDTVTQHVLE